MHHHIRHGVAAATAAFHACLPSNAHTQQSNFHNLHAFVAEESDAKGPSNRSSQQLQGKQGPTLLSKVVLHDLDYYCYPGRSNNSNIFLNTVALHKIMSHKGGNSCPEHTLDLSPDTCLVTSEVHHQRLVCMKIVNKSRCPADNGLLNKRRQSGTDQATTDLMPIEVTCMALA